MSIEHLRGVGKVGIRTDPDPYDLDLQTFSNGVNVRFRNNKITSGPVFRSVIGLSEANPRYAFIASPTMGSDELYIGYQSGDVKLYANGAETNYTLSGYTQSAVEAAWSSTVLDGVVYVNRADRTPWYLLPAGTSFQNLGSPAPAAMTLNAATSTTSPTLSSASAVPANLVIGQSAYSGGLFLGYVLSWAGDTVTLSADCAVVIASGQQVTFSGQWDATWSCQILSQCSNALVAINVTKGATNYPNLIKTSSPVTTGQTPASWDINQANTLATENTLGSMDGPITNACTLGSDLIIYGKYEAWRMHADGTVEVYDYDKLPFKKGCINVNCAVEINGKNYVFGMDDIWYHDGVSENSLCDEKNRDYIFSSMDVSQSYKNFVTYNPRLNEVYFAYVSGDALVNYITGVTGCNRQATLNLTTNEWTFDDLPSIWFAAYAPLPNFQTYASTTDTYSSIGGSYQDQEDGDKRVISMVGDANATYGLTASLYAFDLYDVGSVAPYPVAPAATAPRYLERIGIDLNELNDDIRDYKLVSTIYPIARVDTSGGNSLQVSAGASDNIGDLSPNWLAYQPYDGETNYKVDVNVAGRWLSLRLLWNDYRDLTLTGFDLDLKRTGKR